MSGLFFYPYCPHGSRSWIYGDILDIFTIEPSHSSINHFVSNREKLINCVSNFHDQIYFPPWEFSYHTTRVFLSIKAPLDKGDTQTLRRETLSSGCTILLDCILSLGPEILQKNVLNIHLTVKFLEHLDHDVSLKTNNLFVWAIPMCPQHMMY